MHSLVGRPSAPLPAFRQGVVSTSGGGAPRYLRCSAAAPQASQAASQLEDYAVAAQNIRVQYASQGVESAPALDDATLLVPPGTLHMLLGPNGSGKSTLLRVCAGQVRPSSGRLRVLAPRGYVAQNPDHQVVMPSVGGDIAFSLSRSGLPQEEIVAKVDAALALVGLEGYGLRPVHSLSGGQKQRVAIAGALAEAPRVLLLDELTTFLDPADQLLVLEAVRSLVDGPGRVTALWVTHRLEELRFADAATYIDGGRTVFTAKSGEEMARYIERLR